MEETQPPKNVLEALYPSVGALVIYWSIFEQSLELWVAGIYHSPKSKEFPNRPKRIPNVRAAKIEYLREAFNQPALAEFGKEGHELLDRIEVLAEVRDTLVHRAITSYIPRTEQLRFHRLPVDRGENKHIITPAYLSVNEVLDAGKAILSLMSAALAFGHRLMDTWVR